MTAIHTKNVHATVGGIRGIVSLSIEVGHSYIDASVYGDDWKYYFQSLPEVNGTFEGFFEGMLPSGGQMDVSFMGLSGSAYVDWTVSGRVHDAVRISGRFKGIGAWG